MLKLLLFIAIVANVILAVSSKGSSEKNRCRRHERWVKCPNECIPKSCSEVGFYIPCQKHSNSTCSPSKARCVCDVGYVRNKKGKCIPMKDCPACGGDKNAVSGCGNCHKTCRNYNSTEPIYCIQICYENACDCRKGYVLDQNTKKCVLPKDCTPTCGNNEVFSTCVNGGCHTGRTCDQSEKLNGQKICVKPKECKIGCLCKKGYVRDRNGVCIPENECPYRKCGGRKHEHYEQCSDDCTPRKCSQLGYPLPCTSINGNGTCPTKPGCVCDDGYVRDDTSGICIPRRECPSCGGDKNAVSGCGNCRKTCRNYNSTEPQICPQFCNLNGCNCRDGYVLDENTKKCVLPKFCTPTCGNNEVFSTCVNGGCHTGRTCDQSQKLNGSEICLKPKECQIGCLCKKGYVRDCNGVCIPVNECPYRKCSSKKNEHYEKCPDDCTPRNCSQLGYPLPCTSINGNGTCPTKPGCVCDDGYVRNDTSGICIPSKECPSCGGDKNAVSGCGNCRKTCRNYNSTKPQICPLFCNLNGCNCRDGYVVDENTKKCVLPKFCTPTCGKNEVFSTCVNGGCHTGRTCDQSQKLNGSEICLKPKECQIGCLCEKGYVRDCNGVCIPVNECPYRKCSSRKNEHYEKCPNDCTPRNCSQLGYPLPCTSINGNGTCPTKPGCVCDDGYVRSDTSGICIPSKQCPSCGGDKNAVSGCGNCRKTCRNYNSTKPQICPKFCNLNGCNCRDGYVVDENTKKCVLPKYCTPACGTNEVFNTCINGGCHHGRTCKELDRFNGSIICQDPIECHSGCLCKDGYVRNSKGICIPEYKCPGKNCGGRPHERFIQCPNDCEPKKCSELGYPVPCPGPTADGKCPIQPGCVCDSGFKRDENGICIPIKQCPSCGGDENARNGCGNCPKTCSNYNSTEPQFCLQYCDPNGCDCNEGYVLDELINKCVLPENCSPPCGVNEEINYCINGGCNEPTTCKDLDTFNDTLICSDQLTECQRGCACKYGYLRDFNGVCIPENECPNSKCKGEYETYVPCNYQCAPERCDQLGFPLDCLISKPGPCPGKPACLCRPGYVRNKDGICIPNDQCPSCGGDPNARSGCGGNCGRLCSNYWKAPVACALSCLLNGCDCKDGYVFDDNTRKCVRSHQCTPVCGQNERYTPCVENCSEGRCIHKASSNSKSIAKRRCTAGCVCQDGFVRNSNGVCIPKNECSLNDKCKGRPHEYLNTCPPNCASETCASIGKNIDCPPQAAVCRPRCVCANGYKRNDQGLCILERQCYPCGKNETYDSCLSECPPRVCGVNIAAVTCLRTEIGDCRGGCRCQDGYYRNKQGQCVILEDCPPENPCTKANEVLDECPKKCPFRVCGIDDTLLDCIPGPNPGDPDCPPPICRCDDTFYRDDKGECVEWKDCPKCPKNELYDPCPKPCPPQLCSVDERVIRCAAPPKLGDAECKAGCRCKDGYKRNDDGFCIPKEKCPQWCPVNEEFDPCSPICPPQDCSVDEALILCLPNPEPGSEDCKPSCRCKDGYKRNKDGVCIPKKDCPPICRGAYEIWDPCPNPNDQNTCESVRNNTTNQTQSTDINKCKGACRCKPGYLRNKIGECIAEEDCQKCTGPHEFYSCGGACDNVCSTLSQQNQTYCLIINVKCNEMCYCEDGYARDAQGVCVPISSCRRCKGEHEWYTCPPNCPPNDSCDTYGKSYSCPNQPIPPPKCKKPICICEDNYLRDKNGNCIPQEKCPCNGDPNAEPGCGCSKTCSDYHENLQHTCDKICIKGACDCKEGYVRNEKTGKCILPKDCPPKCPKNEVYEPCLDPCPRQLCSVDERLIKCAAPPKPGDAECKAGCRCKDGYKRNKNGFCIPKEECPRKCTGPHEYNSCGGACDNVCSTLSQQNQTHCPIINIKCNDMCYCEKGYARNGQGICVPISSCRSCEGEHEWYDTCPSKCFNDSCKTYGKVYSCPNQPIPPKCGKPICRCEDNYLRDEKGDCIRKEKCPCNGDPNAKPGCGCSKTCSDYYANKPPTCTKDCKVGACDCKEGYVRNEKTGKCILPKDCPVPQCPKNEMFDLCPFSCPPETCPDGRVYKCPAPPKPGSIECKPRCRCKDGHYRNDEGICIPEDQCPQICRGPNESWDSCPDLCALITCEDIYNTKACKHSAIEAKDCKGACMCNRGFYRNKIGECISKKNCLKCTGPYEYYSCGGACDNVCSTLSQRNQTKCPIINIKCNEMCYCVKGYARNGQGICVPIKSCRSCTGKNEWYDTCPADCPLNESCNTYGKPRKCQPESSKCREPICRCEDNYLRDEKGDCIPEEQCPCNEDPNAQPGCGCSKTCSDYYANTPPFCTRDCKVGACDCKEGYVRNEKTGKCILPKDCPVPQCPKNEVYDPCRRSCPPETCPDGRVYDCAAPLETDGEDCRPGCRCKDGFYRNDEGYCVPEDQCPSCNEDPNSTPGCCGQTCSDNNPNETPVCNKLCTIDACQCKKGYALNENSGKCVLPENCPASPCGRNEEFSKCTQGLCRHQECSKKGTPVACPDLLPGSCLKGCVCKEKYLRLANGTCVHEDICPINTQNGTDALQALSRGLNIFAFKFLRQVLRIKSGENVIMSPFSAQVALAELAMFGENNTLKELLDSLNLLSKDQIRQAFPVLLEALQGSDEVIFEKAIISYIRQRTPVTKTFIDTIQEIFNGTSENIDFSDPNGAANHINEWVKSKTNNRIQNLISPDAINDLTRLILVNAVFFKANWKDQFNKNKTKEQDFYTYDNRTVKIPMMHIETKFDHANDDTLDAQLLRIPYTNPNYTFLIVLPNDKNGLDKLLANLNADTMEAAYGKLYSKKVDLYLPTMEIDTGLELIEILKALDINDLFDAEKSDLQGILKVFEPLFVTTAVQKAHFKCDETGSEAAAATGVVVSNRAQPRVIQVVADHPFLFFVMHNKNVIFCGGRLT